MSTAQITFTGFEARLKGYGIMIIGEAPDGIEIPVFIEGEDIRKFYDMNPASFIDAYGDNAKVLCELFQSMNGLKVIDND